MRTFPSIPFSKGHQYLECPRWHDGRLWASDFFTGQVMTFDGNGQPTTVAQLKGVASGIGFLPDGSPLVVSQADQKVLRLLPGGGTEEYADFGGFIGGVGNDMLVSPAGHAYVGNFGFALGEEDPRTTNLVHIDPSGTVRPVEGDLLFPNGEALTPEGVLLVAETFASRISAFDVQPDGSLSDHRIWAQLDASLHPDGIALDADGGVWFGNALTNGPDSGFYRVVEGGEITDKVQVEDGAWAVACAFGGPDLTTFYGICSQTTLADFHEGRSSSVITTADVGRAGVPTS
ncbi:SMP-30/gluconolactonase/LRE family protein [Blastococcus tunisiensis]|uniref:Sugar lactone lactonase YvrE n=1 Tax=Blastococcus tunisiensis TaxID=1798228 RepID=A0A1I2KTI8_9ACTN|nr:SMP-30/gluconolactonase/LRE family protein [Blastococcus sp. DSM 46838]SFF68216.1 Sugar lactone lactonase YvrE [Blastococcus sp. DSM 46838]